MYINRDGPEHGRGLDRAAVVAMLPKVGDVRMEILTISDKQDIGEPQECVVVEVHPAHLWYRVRFTASGLHECYKIPETKRQSWEVEE